MHLWYKSSHFTLKKKVEGNIMSKTHLPRLQYHTKVHLIESQNHGNKPLTKPVMSVANNAKTFIGILEKIRYEMKSSFQSLGWLLLGERWGRVELRLCH